MVPKSCPCKRMLNDMYPLSYLEGPGFFFAKEKTAGQGSWGRSKSRALKANQGSYHFRLLIEAQAQSLDSQ